MEAKIPPEMCFSGNISQNWKTWKQKFENFLIASGKHRKVEEVKIAVFLNVLGDDGLEIYNTFELTDDDKKLDTILKKFEEYCIPIKNLVYEHYKFLKRDQLDGESVDQFVIELKKLASSCEFAEKNVMIRDRIVLGIKNPKIQEKLLEKANVTLEDALNIARALESGEAKQKEISNTNEICAVNRSYNQPGPSSKNSPLTHYKTNFGENSGIKDRNMQHNYTSGETSLCDNCGYNHPKNDCRAKNRICSKCKKVGHYYKMCKKNISVNEMSINSVASSSKTDKIVWSIKTPRKNNSVNTIDWSVPVKINNVVIYLKVDTGSQVNILSITDYNKVKVLNDKMKPSDANLSSYTGHKLNVIGVTELKCSYNNNFCNLVFYIVSGKNSALLGLSGSISLKLVDLGKRENLCKINLISKNSSSDILTKYDKIFKGLGKIDTAYHIELSENAIPVVSAARKIPIALHDIVKKKLDEMVEQNILIPTPEPTDWSHPIVCVPKPSGDVRICIDPRNLNKYIRRPHHHIPTQEQLFTDLQNANYFTKLDASSAFLQVPLDEPSSYLCTISTIFGRFRYTRLPYGLSSAPEFFQQMNENVLVGTGAKVYFDDILVYGSTIEEHNRKLESVLKKLVSAGITLNKEKSVFCTNQLKFLGHIISNKGITADPEKIKAITSMNAPKNTKELQRFLGLITYLGKFVSNLSEQTTILRNLLKSKTAWVWTNNEQRSFEKLKELLSSTPVLRHFNPDKSTVLSVDASQFGLGALMLQEDHPIEYASVSLTPTQQRYNQIEKELLAIVFGFERFHYYLFAQRNIVVETDHRPLLGLLKKPLDDLSPRLQRLVLRLLRYKFELRYVPGKKLIAADALSRDPTGETIDTKYLNEDILHVHSVLITTKEKAKRLTDATNEDEILHKIKYYVFNGWPHHKSNLDSELKSFWSIKDDIFCHDEVLFYKKRLIVPKSLRNEFLSLIHQNHQGVVLSKNVAQETIYWPGISKDVENMVLSCMMCQMHSKSNIKQPLHPHDIPKLPWEKVGIDFKSDNGVDFLVVVDYLSKFLVLNRISSKTAVSVISNLKNIFVMHGIPQTIFSDNGPPFQSREFKEFANQYTIDLQTSAPLYPKSNGMIERTIEDVKALLQKSNDDLFLAVLNYNNTPKIDNKSPSELLMGRRLRAVIPVHIDILKPKFPVEEGRMYHLQNKFLQQKYYNKGSKKLQPLKVGQRILYQKGIREWRPAVVMKCDGYNYLIKTKDNYILRRNRIHLKLLIENRGDPIQTHSNQKNHSNLNLYSDNNVSTNDGNHGTVAVEHDFEVLPEEAMVNDGNRETMVVGHDVQPRSRSGRLIQPPDRLDL